jgi:hypothetical protein
MPFLKAFFWFGEDLSSEPDITRFFVVVVVNLLLLFMQVQYCRVNHKRLIHFSTCEVYGKTIGSFLPADSPLKKVPKKSNLLTNWFCELQ